MPLESNRVTLYRSNVDSRLGAFLSAVYGWMFAGLALTGAVAYWVSLHPQVYKVFLNKGALLGLFLVELLLVMIIAAAAEEIGGALASFLFLLYAAVNGATLSCVFLVYTKTSICSTFLICSGVFGVMSLYGAVTKQNLTSMGHLFFTALIGLLFAMIVNMFLGSPALDYIISGIGVLLFVGLTAYDTQKLIEMGDSGSDAGAVQGALTLYLDFINLFLFLLRFVGKGKD